MLAILLDFYLKSLVYYLDSHSGREGGGGGARKGLGKEEVVRVGVVR